MGLREEQIQKQDFTDKEIKEIRNTLKLILHQANGDDYIKIFNEYEMINGQNTFYNYLYQTKELLNENKLRKILKNVDVVDLYHSANTYKTYQGATENNLAQLLNVVIDVDYTKAFFFGKFSPEKFLAHLEREVYGQVIPCPSVSVYTGNNYHLIYYLKSAVNATINAKALTKRIQKHITTELKEYKADKNVNLTTMLRFNKSMNAKTGNIVTYKVHNKTYFLSDLKEILPDTPEWYESWKEKKKQGKKAKIQHLFSVSSENGKIQEIRMFSLLKARITDLETIQSLRDNKCFGKREIMCYLYRNFAVQIMTTQEAEDAMYVFNNNFVKPLIEKRIESKTRNVEKRSYKYKNDTIIDVLEISIEEEKHMSTIISKEEKDRRQKERDQIKAEKRKTDRRNEKGLTKRQQEKLDKLNKVKELQKQGYTNEKIAEKLEISIRQVQRLKE